MPIIRPNKGYLRKYSPLTPLPLTPLRVPMKPTQEQGKARAGAGSPQSDHSVIEITQHPFNKNIHTLFMLPVLIPLILRGED